MTKNYIKHPISEDFNEQGGAVVLFVDTHTVPLDTSIKEAKEGLFVLGDEQLVKANFVGLFKSMAAGVARDGKPRTIADFLTVYPVLKGEIDLDKGYDPEKNEVRIVVRLLNEMELDITDWTFVDVTPGRVPFTIDSVSSGADAGVLVVGEPVAINGRGLPKTGEITVDWEVRGTTLSGRVDAAKVTSDGYRADIAANAFSGLPIGTDGKELVLTVRGNLAKASKAMTVSFAQPVGPTITRVKQEGRDDDTVVHAANSPCTIEGVGLSLGAGDTVKIELYSEDGVLKDAGDCTGKVTASGDTAIQLSGFVWNNESCPDGDWWNVYPRSKVVVTKNGTRIEHAVTFLEP